MTNRMSLPDGQIALVAHLRAKPGCRDQLAAIIDDAWSEEPGMQVVAMHEVFEDPDMLIFFEVYESLSAAQAHGRRDRDTGVWGRIEELLAEPMQITLLRPRRATGIPALKS